MDYKIGGTWGSYKVKTTEFDAYLKLVNKEKVLTGYYAKSPDKWVQLGKFGNYFNFKKVCLGASNGGTVNSDIVGLFDYFLIEKP